MRPATALLALCCLIATPAFSQERAEPAPRYEIAPPDPTPQPVQQVLDGLNALSLSDLRKMSNNDISNLHDLMTQSNEILAAEIKRRKAGNLMR